MPSETDSLRDSTSPTVAVAPFTVVPTDQALAKWICPSCTGVASDQPRVCPRCGRAFVPGVLSSDSASPAFELRSMTRRLWLALLLGVPLIGIGAFDALAGVRPL